MDFDVLNKYLNYLPKTGIFIWKKRGIPSFDSKFAGKQAGTEHVSTTGRRSIKIKIEGKSYYAHRIAWVLMTGDWPEGVVDHKDQNSMNNRWTNLRDVSQAINMKNRKMPSSNKTGIPNCYFCTRTNKYVVKVAPFGYIGSFTNKKDAEKESRAARIRAGYSRSHGKK
tara:strand:- start:1888 stop:2391 length:504 start_codon:yes stop_codon:yes gene_type:complete